MSDLSQVYNDEALRIIELLNRDFLLESGALCHKRTNGKRSKHHIMPDLGDVVPFLYYFNKYELVEKQLRALPGILKNDILVSEFPTLKIRGLAKSYEYSDFILGLIDVYSHAMTQESQLLLSKHVDIMTEIFSYRKKIRSWYWPSKKIKLPVIDSRDGMMIELYVELYKLFNKQEYLDVAKNIASQLVALPFYKKYHLFPTLHIVGVPLWITRLLGIHKCSKADISKVNTNTLYGLLELYKVTKDTQWLATIDTTIRALQRHATIEKGGIVEYFSLNDKPKASTLTASFMVLDFLCDVYQVTNDPSYIEYARQIADYWIDLQTGLGLFPLKSNGNKTFLDSETDMTIALHKLHELTGDKKYYNAAEKCLNGIIAHHGSKDYVLGVDSKTGEIVDNYQKTKFLALFLKLLILKIEQLKGSKIYSNNSKLFNLLKDR